MTALECLRAAQASGDHYTRPINAFVDAFRRASRSDKERMACDPIATCGPLEGLVAATLSALCREAGVPAPAWVDHVRSNEPFFAFPARGFAMRVRLMVESPAPFRIRNVFVPETFLDRA
jgi:hypothetical protein